ncbi:MAG: hypothetical protein QG597_1156 [Actinomycetota bacterium]|nr:hypothetical protein [Actinomycetota bacterium]
MTAPLADPEGSVSPPIEGVVVGFDGSPAAQVALEWGAAAAVAHGTALTILRSRPDAEAPLIELTDDSAADELVGDGIADDLATAVEHVNSRHPDLTIHTVVTPDSPVDSLLAASETADLIAIGSRGMEGFAGLLIGSTVMEVTPYARCPVVVLYVPDADTEAAREVARHPGSVVVGFDGSGHSQEALTFALRHAAALGLGVTVVHISGGSPKHDPVPVSPDADELTAEVREDLDQAVRIARNFPAVPVSYLHAVGRPAGILIREASGSALVVVGARGRGGFAQLLLGSVGLQLVIHAECPVAVVHHLPTDPASSGPAGSARA